MLRTHERSHVQLLDLVMTLSAAPLGAGTWPGLFSVNVEVDIRLQLQSLLQQVTDVSDALLVAIGRLLIIPL